jgi:molecular chaperone DnaJ
MADTDYYADLGVAHDASPEDIRRAFRKLAAQYHPDRHPGDKAAEAKFKKMAEAYRVLDDPKARAAYDQGGQTQVEADTGFRGFNTTEDIFSRYGDIFGDLFGDRIRRGAAAEPGEDYEVELSISFEEAARGGKKSFVTNAPGACDACHGIGSADGRPHPCPTCQGNGQVSQRARKTGGFFSVTTPCPLCHGTGVDPAAACPRCRGARIETHPRTIEISIPQAVGEGTVLRLRQMGAPGRGGGPPGDLLIHIRIQPGGPFEREGLHLKRGVTVDLLTAVLGGKAEVPLVEGKAEMTIPPGTQPGQQFRLKGQGLSDGREHGDLIVTVQVRIPRQLSEEERRIFETLRAAGTPSTG